MRKFIALLIALMALSTECAAESWELVKSDSLGFEAEFPGKPEFNEQLGDDGGKIRTYVLHSSAAAYDVTIWDLPEGAVTPENLAQILDNFRDVNLYGITAKLRTETKMEIGGHQARDVVADVMGMVWRGRLVIAGNRLYQIVAIVSKDAAQSQATERYLASLKLHGGAAGEPKK